jgi:antitoxin VapB
LLFQGILYILYILHVFQKDFIMLTRVFKSGNSLAVRIPKELHFVDAAQDVEVERVGNTLVLRPVVRETLAGIGEIFGMFSPSFMTGGREFHPERERDWSGGGTTGNT